MYFYFYREGEFLKGVLEFGVVRADHVEDEEKNIKKSITKTVTKRKKKSR